VKMLDIVKFRQDDPRTRHMRSIYVLDRRDKIGAGL
jgi:hypothetical protein